MSVAELWNSTVSFTVFQRIWIGILLMLGAAVLYWANWYCAQSAMKEYGYPSVSGKRLRRRWKTYSFGEKLFLTKLKKEAKRVGFALDFYWFLNVLNLACAAATVTGYVFFLIGTVHGWEIILMLFVPFGALLFTAAVTFLPDLMFLPSERRRYFTKKKK